MERFVELSDKEKKKVDGGMVVVDDIIFWKLVGTGFAAGIALGMNRKNRDVDKK